MARRESQRVEIGRVPCGDDLAPRGGVGADLLDQFGDLIEMAAIGGRPIAPLLAVDGAEIAAFVGPFVPDGHLAILQPADVGVAAQEPEQFDDDRAQMALLGRSEEPTTALQYLLRLSYGLLCLKK